MIFNDIEEGHMNLVDHETTEKIILDVMRDVSNGVKHTLGPGGKTTLLHDPNGVTSLYPSKDGFRLITNMHFDDYFYESIYMILRDVSVHTNMTVGDATTSCIVIMAEFYKKVLELYKSQNGPFKYISANGIGQILEVTSAVLKDFLYEKNYIIRLEDLSIDERREVVKKVAAVAANNDKSIGNDIAGIYEGVLETLDDLFVTITPNEGGETTTLGEIGFEAPIGHINRAFSTERDGATASYDNPNFLMIEGPLLDGDIKYIQPVIEYVCLGKNEPLVIIADDYSNLVSEFLYKLRAGGMPFVDPNTKQQTLLPPLKLLPIMHSTSHDLGHERMIDLNVALGGIVQVCQSNKLEIIPTDPGQIELMLGKADKIISAQHITRIFNGHGSKEKIKARIDEIQSLMDNLMMRDSDRVQSSVYVYKERIGMLKSNMVAIKVGGMTYKEKQYRVLVYEDAVYAVRSTIKNGYTLGGQVSFQHLITKYYDELVEAIYKEIHNRQYQVIFGSKKSIELKNAIALFLEVVKDTTKVSYCTALSNAIVDDEHYEDVIDTVYGHTLSEDKYTERGVLTYNLMNDTYESLSHTNNLLVAGNTDYEVLESVIGVTKLFLNSEYIQTIYVPKRKVGGESGAGAEPKENFKVVQKTKS